MRLLGFKTSTTHRCLPPWVLQRCSHYNIKETTSITYDQKSFFFGWRFGFLECGLKLKLLKNFLCSFTRDIFLDFWIFLAFWLFWFILDFLAFFWVFFLRIFLVSFKVTKVTTKFYHSYYWTPKITKNGPKQHKKLFFCPKGVKSSFFARRVKKASAKALRRS